LLTGFDQNLDQIFAQGTKVFGFKCFSALLQNINALLQLPDAHLNGIRQVFFSPDPLYFETLLGLVNSNFQRQKLPPFHHL